VQSNYNVFGNLFLKKINVNFFPKGHICP